MKKITTLLIAFVAIALLVSTAYADADISLNGAKGTFNVKFSASDYTNYKVLVQKDGQKYVYNLFKADEIFPLQMGSGSYTIGVYENTTGNKYKKVTSITKNVQVDEMNVYKASVQNIDWTKTSQSTALAGALAKDYASETERFNAIYGYVIKSIAYDYGKADQLRNATRYIPSNDMTLQQQKGICYDYSSLTASMLRSLDIPTRLVEGNSSFTADYHAWNEVYLDGKWVTIDTTVDAQYELSNVPYTFQKSVQDYAKVKNY